MAKTANSLPNFYEQIGGGDGLPAPDTGAPADPILSTQPQDASADDAALDAKISETLGLPRAEVRDDQAAAGANGDDNQPGGDGSDGGGDGTGDQGGAGQAGAGESGDGAAAGDTGDGGQAADAAAAAGDQGAEQAAAATQAQKPVDKPAEAATVDPEKYKLEVEDASGNKFKIGSIDELPDDFTPKNNKQALQILDDLRELKQQRTKDEAAAAEKAEIDRVKGEEAAVQKGWKTEIDALRADGRLDKPKIAEGQPGFLEDPAIKRLDQIFGFMLEENTARIAKGIAPIRSVTDALTHLELKEAREAKTAADKASADIAKRKAGMLNGAGGAGNSNGVTEQPYRAGQATDIFDVINR